MAKQGLIAGVNDNCFPINDRLNFVMVKTGGSHEYCRCSPKLCDIIFLSFMLTETENGIY